MTRKDILQTLSKFQRDRRDEFGIVRLEVFGATSAIKPVIRAM